MATINKIILMGNLGKDPKVSGEGTRLRASFSIATSESYRGKDGTRTENTDWHNIVLWGGLAEVAAKYLKKGDQVYVEGRITTRSYEDETGAMRYVTEVVGREMKLMGGGRNGGERETEEGSPFDEVVEPLNDAKDLPF